MDGNELRRRREAAGLTQEQVAEMVGLTGKHRRQTIHRLEAGKEPFSDRMAILLDRALPATPRRRRKAASAA